MSAAVHAPVATAPAFDPLTAPLTGRHLIEASAGTGKTWTLCLLYARLVMERGLRPRQILVVTFTKAATAELRERIRERLDTTLRALPVDADATRRQHLQLALAEFDEAAIQTIHGFCHRALADAPIASQTPLAIDFLTDDDPLTPQACADAWRQCFADPAAPPLPAALAARLAAKPITPATLTPLVQRRLAKPLAVEHWPDPPAASDLDTATFEQEFADFAAVWSAERPAIAAELQQALVEKRLNGRSYTARSIEQCLTAWDDWLRAGALTPVPEKADLLDFSLANRVNKGKIPPAQPLLSAAEPLLRRAEGLADAVDRAWLRLLKDLIDAAADTLRGLKRRLGQASYDDILGNLHAALTAARGPALAQTLRTQYPAALIDEFQDTDPLQLEIVRRIWLDGDSTACTLYLVGDPKQAIYAFRNADVHTYLSARDAVDDEATLRGNQRAAEPLIAGLNALFGQVPDPFLLAGLHYPPADVGAKPRAQLHDPAQPASMLLWEITPAAPVDGEQPFTRNDAESQTLAAMRGEIQRLLGDPAVTLTAPGDQGRGRRVRPADIVVLVRSHAQARRVRQTLAGAGIASVELSQASVFASAEAAELRRLLAALATPRHHGRLRAALASELIGLSADALDPHGDDDPQTTLADAAQHFADAHARWQTHGFARAWRELLARFDCLPRTLARPDGERRLTNLRHLVELLQTPADQHGPGDALLHWLDARMSGDGPAPGGAEAAQLRLDSDRDLVHVVTIHRAKGLEYPVVFCPFLCAPPSVPRERMPGIEYHATAQTHLSFLPDDDAARRARAHESFQEELRLIYVAVTRAEHRLVLPVGVCASGPWQSLKPMLRAPLNALVASDGGSLDDWLAEKPRQNADTIAAGWRAVAAKAPGLALQPLPVLPNPAGAADADSPAPPSARNLRTRVLNRRLAADWHIGSFTGLMRQASRLAAPETTPAEDPAADHDRAFAEPPPESAEQAAAADAIVGPATPPPHDILAFPRGALAGESLHAVLEHTDFTDPASWPATIARALHRRPPRHAAGDDHDAPDPAWLAGVRQMLADLTTTALPVGGDPAEAPLRLATLAAADRLNEWPFLLPARLTGSALAERLRQAGYRLPPLAGAQLDGYLKGIVDLVFRHQGRYYLADWKSNHLGDRAADYATAPVAAAMQAHGYAVQALLYALALHRFLRTRRPDYRPETHFGGVYYLFVRGVRPGWRNADGGPCGVWFDRPAAALLDDLDRLAGP